MVNIAMCFDDAAPQAGDNIAALGRLLDTGDQLVWHGAADAAAEAYRFLTERWQPGDHIHVFGSGAGAVSALGLTRLLDTLGIAGGPLHDGALHDVVLDYALAHWALPTSVRTPTDWHRLHSLGWRLRGTRPSVPVHYLGLWDGVESSAAQRNSRFTGFDNVICGRHAVAIDERRAALEVHSPRVEEVWFCGTHAAVVGARGTDPSRTLAARDWVLAGAWAVGLAHRGDATPPPAAPRGALDRRTPAMGLLAGVRLPIRRRRMPDGALVHRSVEPHLRTDDRYWKRLPHCFTWVDPERPPERLPDVGTTLENTATVEALRAS
ncbi:DUF2235 domain-containing protein [Mycobacterium sp. ACS4331]|uniref:phospholipase effector Tle1 domain-containing protein n=1 Tax=Mycobacterium sp. ACS4331 TaxID=1834121 RepID=UPI00080120EE|nr:DUF2235 domain-containing protein [Mycobacterium sp. ACS4331]OBF18466.1 hypothetical protein A5727_10995 [Mycobacterium sp. ACS4331]